MLKQYTCEKCGCSFEKDVSATAICTICGSAQAAVADVADGKMVRDQAKSLLFLLSYGGYCKQIGYTDVRLYTLEELKQSYPLRAWKRAPDATLAEGRRDNGPKRPIKG